jgi:hypothetical protein|tara:strand:+ start:4607 stop:4852 length:246 start_codon:yes stop_codon:yes gene_type:complete
MSVINQLLDTQEESKLTIFYPTIAKIDQDDTSINIIKDQILQTQRLFSSTTVNDGSEENIFSSNIKIIEDETITTTIKNNE